MAATSRIAALKSALVDLWTARSGLSGVQVVSAEIAGDRAENEFIALIGEDQIDQDWAQIGRYSRDETITLTGMIYVLKPGADETVIRSARDRCLALMAELEASLTGTSGDPSVGGVVRFALARPVELQEFVITSGRVALLRFEIRTGPTRLTAS